MLVSSIRLCGLEHLHLLWHVLIVAASSSRYGCCVRLFFHQTLPAPVNVLEARTGHVLAHLTTVSPLLLRVSILDHLSYSGSYEFGDGSSSPSLNSRI